MDIIHEFINQCRKRLTLKVLIQAITAGFCLNMAILLIWAGYDLFRGHAVSWEPLHWFPLGLVGLSALVFLKKRPKSAQITSFSDNFFDLKDGLTTTTSLAKQSLNSEEAAFFHLQVQTIGANCQQLEAKSIPLDLPKKWWFCLLLYAALWLILSQYEESDAVRNARLEAQYTAEFTAGFEKQLPELVEALRDELSEEEQALLDQTGLAEQLTEFGATEDRMEALKKLAVMEREIKAMEQAMNPADDLAMLKAMAAELAKSAEASQLAQSLQQQKLDEAAEQLKKMADINSADSVKDQLAKAKRLQKAAEAMQKAAKELKQNKSQLGQKAADLASKAQQLAKALQKQGQQQSQNQQSQKNQQKSAKSSSSEQNQQKSGKQQAQKEGQKSCKSGCQSCQQSGRQMAQAMQQAGARQKVAEQLQKLADQMAQTQQKLSQQSALGDKPGKGIGQGSGLGKKSMPTAKNSLGRNDEVALNKSDAPMMTSTEETDEADTSGGMARRQRANRDYKRQMEAFINRSDVPIPVRQTVKEYFNQLHNQETTAHE